MHMVNAWGIARFTLYGVLCYGFSLLRSFRHIRVMLLMRCAEHELTANALNQCMHHGLLSILILPFCSLRSSPHRVLHCKCCAFSFFTSNAAFLGETPIVKINPSILIAIDSSNVIDNFICFLSNIHAQLWEKSICLMETYFLQ